MPTNGEALDVEVQRLSDLSAQSDRDNTVLVEMVYRGKWVRFDISGMEAEFLTLGQLGERYFGQAFQAIGLARAPGADTSSSETPS